MTNKKDIIKTWIATSLLVIAVITESILSILKKTTEVHYTWWEFIISCFTVIPSYYICYQLGKSKREPSEFAKAQTELMKQKAEYLQKQNQKNKK